MWQLICVVIWGLLNGLSSASDTQQYTGDVFSLGDLQLSLRPLIGVADQCKTVIDPEQYPETKDWPIRQIMGITSITAYYKCPETKDCCDAELCCIKATESPRQTSFFSPLVLVGLASAALALIVFCLCHRFYMKPRKRMDHELCELNSYG